MFVLTPAVHSLLGLVISQEQSLTGPPSVPLLLPFVAGQAVLMVIVYHAFRERLPGRRGWLRGLRFGALFLLSVQIPSVFGLIAFEPASDWQLFTPAKLANYATLLGDSVVFLAVGALLGALFPPRSEAPRLRLATLLPAMTAGLALFPLAMWGIMHLGFHVVALEDPNAPVGRSLWFDLVFYGAFFLTGLCLPLLHALLRTGEGLGAALRSAGLFALLWLPVQNFMVVFGWEAWGALFFSALSMVPVLLVFFVAEVSVVRCEPGAAG